MEPLRIRIPRIFQCRSESCTRYLRAENALCSHCFLDTRMREKVTTAALPNKTKLVHRTSLGRDLGT